MESGDPIMVRTPSAGHASSTVPPSPARPRVPSGGVSPAGSKLERKSSGSSAEVSTTLRKSSSGEMRQVTTSERKMSSSRITSVAKAVAATSTKTVKRTDSMKK